MLTHICSVNLFMTIALCHERLKMPRKALAIGIRLVSDEGRLLRKGCGEEGELSGHRERKGKTTWGMRPAGEQVSG